MSLVDREILLSFTHGMGNGPTSNDIARLLETRFDVTAVHAKDLLEDDFVKEDIEPNITKRKIRGPLNLRRHNENKLREGDLCMVEGLEHSPKMLIEHIGESEDPNESIQKKHISAMCCWFVNNDLKRYVFKVEQLKKVTKEEPVKKVSKIQDSNMYGISMNQIARDYPTFREHMYEGRKINAIKEVRGLTDLGLKEAKDMVEAVTPIMIANWQQGIFE